MVLMLAFQYIMAWYATTTEHFEKIFIAKYHKHKKTPAKRIYNVACVPVCVHVRVICISICK